MPLPTTTSACWRASQNRWAVVIDWFSVFWSWLCGSSRTSKASPWKICLSSSPFFLCKHIVWSIHSVKHSFAMLFFTVWSIQAMLIFAQLCGMLCKIMVVQQTVCFE
jgi:hypothetical protein